jgi:hypothetical protein
MGFLSDLFGSSSHSQTTTSTSNVTNTQLSGGPLSGTVAYGTGNRITVTQSDQGAIQKATDISDHALALGQSELDSSTQVALAGFSTVAQQASKADDLVARFASSALDSNTYIAGKSLDALSSAYSASLTQVANNQSGTLATVEGLAAQVSQSNQQSTDQTLTRVAMYAALAAVAFLLLRK